MQLLFEAQEPLGLGLFQAGERDAGHGGDHLGDDFLIDDAVHFLGLVPPLFLHPLFLAAQALDLVAQLGGLLVVRGLDGLVLLDGSPLDLLFDIR